MTNQEKNMHIADLYLPCDYIITNKVVELVGTVTKLGPHGEPYEVIEKYGEFNPCEDYNQLMPLCFDNGITFDRDINGYFAVSPDNKTFNSYNARTALVDCLIATLKARE